MIENEDQMRAKATMKKLKKQNPVIKRNHVIKVVMQEYYEAGPRSNRDIDNFYNWAMEVVHNYFS